MKIFRLAPLNFADEFLQRDDVVGASKIDR